MNGRPNPYPERPDLDVCRAVIQKEGSVALDNEVLWLCVVLYPYCHTRSMSPGSIPPPSSEILCTHHRHPFLSCSFVRSNLMVTVDGDSQIMTRISGTELTVCSINALQKTAALRIGRDEVTHRLHGILQQLKKHVVQMGRYVWHRYRAIGFDAHFGCRSVDALTDRLRTRCGILQCLADIKIATDASNEPLSDCKCQV